MPSARSNLLMINKKIAELEEREAANGGLSESNAMFLEYLKKWREFAGTDPIIVIQPKGALQRSGQPVPAKIISVTDQVGADLFAFAGKRGQLVRMATPEECDAYHAHVKAQQNSHVMRAAAERSAIATASIQALLGHSSQPVPVAMPTNSGPGPLTVPFHVPAPDASALVPANLGTEASVGDGAESEKGSPAGDQEATGLSAIAGPVILKKLFAGGLTTVEQIADASPDQIVALGIASNTAASLIADAAAAVALAEESAGGAGADAAA